MGAEVSVAAEYLMLGVALASVLLWGALFGLAVQVHLNGHERFDLHRRAGVTLVGLLAAIGMLASLIAYLQGVDLLPLFLSRDVLHFVAGVGRGALLMGGLLLWTAHDRMRQT